MRSKQAVVVGAGIGGLTAAITLLSNGIPVTLVEKSQYPGGKIRQIEVAGKMINVGPTVFTMRWIFETLFTNAGFQFSDHVNLIENSVLARHSWLGSDTLDLFTNTEQSLEAIEQLAGSKEADNYAKFVRKTEALFNTLNKPFMHAERPNPLSLTFGNGLNGFMSMSRTQPYLSLWRALSQSFNDPRLVMLFARYATYCGSSPLQAPATLMLIAHVEKAGVWVIDGGMKALADALLVVAKSLGCECIFGHSVEQIRTDSSGVCGVTLNSGSQLATNTVIFNGDPNAISSGGLGSACAPAVSTPPQYSLSAVTRSQVAQTEGFELAHHNVFFGDNYPAEFNALFKQQNLCVNPTVYVCAQDRLDNHPPTDNTNNHSITKLTTSSPQLERLFSLINAPARNLSDAEIDQANLSMTQHLQAHGLQLTNEQGIAKVDTPNTFAELFPASDGALYGKPTHGMMGSFKRPTAQTKIRGLYLTGGSVHPGPGVPMVALSGQNAAQRVINDLEKTH